MNEKAAGSLPFFTMSPGVAFRKNPRKVHFKGGAFSRAPLHRRRPQAVH
jgi:hypothetical protein